MPQRPSDSEQVPVAHGGGYPRAVAAPRDEVLDRVAAAFQPYAPSPLTRDDAREITANLVRVFDVLQEWALEDAAKGMGPWGGLVEQHPDHQE